MSKCRLFNCDKERRHQCCAFCQHRTICKNPCLNHPDRCGQLREETPKEYAAEAKIRFVNSTMARMIIKSRKPLGLFIQPVNMNLYIGINNRTGNAWTEEFPTKMSCLKWLAGEVSKEAGQS